MDGPEGEEGLLSTIHGWMIIKRNWKNIEEAFALVERYPRDRFTIADKLPAWKLKSEEDVERIFNESLERCGVEYFDFYLLHSMEESHLPTYEKYHCFEFVQLQLNYLDWEDGVIQSRKNYETARKHKKPIVVMEPVKGGTLAAFPEDVEKIYKDYAPDRSVASWALRYIASQDGVMTVLSGMSNEKQMNDNLRTFTEFIPMSEEEYGLVKEVTSRVLSFPTIPCTGCRYCVPGCPMNIQIPDLFTDYNSTKTYGPNRRYEIWYKNHTRDGYGTASACGEFNTLVCINPEFPVYAFSHLVKRILLLPERSHLVSG